MTNAERAAYGRAAVEVGTPDLGQNGPNPEGFQTDAADTIANVLHALSLAGGDTDAALRTATTNFDVERSDI